MTDEPNHYQDKFTIYNELLRPSSLPPFLLINLCTLLSRSASRHKLGRPSRGTCTLLGNTPRRCAFAEGRQTRPPPQWRFQVNHPSILGRKGLGPLAGLARGTLWKIFWSGFVVGDIILLFAYGIYLWFSKISEIAIIKCSICSTIGFIKVV